MNSTLDWLRPYSVPRAALVTVLFAFAVAVRVAVLAPALVVHIGDRIAERVVGFAGRIPPEPIRTVTRPHGSRGRKQR